MMTLTTARTVVREYARNAGDSLMYPDAQVDRAIAAVGNDFVRVARCLKQKSTVDLTADTASITLDITGFRPEMLLKAWIGTEPPLAVGDFLAVLQLRQYGDSNGVPSAIGFDTWTTAELWPTPDVAYTLNLLWTPSFTTFTPGIDADAADAIELNVPEEWLYPVLMDGAAALLQHNEPEHAYASTAWQRYEKLRDSLRGVGNLGAKVVYSCKGSR